ncbi:exosome complex exonuclease RRP4 [Culex quinquefasciatus]|uniref:Exosome complex component RRP4 n=1 Tax=Culex quinquefasciatus TaxID=7176 RepID=B0XEH0_CULQU|nr:exosome complex component RRP4 [Culex quinquefasciatus]EDS25967.1 exosome complex exonuclease RRP4 [Culex quinquefasciatus]|eukprot:XP_001868042.1 exosome complex exonuclease RRP4 [Culex quinquefasciatus]
MASNVIIKLASDRVNPSLLSGDSNPRLFTPGEVITSQQGFMRGHGTYMEDEDIKSSVAGVMVQVNKLITVKALKGRYVGEIGDVVVARVTDVQQKRWKVDTNSRLDSILLLSSVNLPGGELRRRGVEDEQQMRKYLQEGDLISAEVQNVHSDGVLSLHTRSLKYGKLGQGILVKVFPSLIKRRKTHFHNLPCGASIILGNNGFIWISPVVNTEGEDGGGFTQNLDEAVSKQDREVISRLRNSILALAHCKMLLYDTSILYAYEESLKYDVHELLHQEAMFDIAFLTQHKLRLQE